MRWSRGRVERRGTANSKSNFHFSAALPPPSAMTAPTDGRTPPPPYLPSDYLQPPARLLLPPPLRAPTLSSSSGLCGEERRRGLRVGCPLRKRARWQVSFRSRWASSQASARRAGAMAREVIRTQEVYPTPIKPCAIGSLRHGVLSPPRYIFFLFLVTPHLPQSSADKQRTARLHNPERAVARRLFFGASRPALSSPHCDLHASSTRENK